MASQEQATSTENATTTELTVVSNAPDTTSFDNLFPLPAKTANVLPPLKTSSKTASVPTVRKTPIVVSTPPVVSSPSTKAPVTTTIPVASAPAPSTGIAGSVVNILCTPHTSAIAGSSGSGVIIDSRGIILTVAHVAEYELLEEALGSSVMSCVVRTGSPARTAYTARVVYLPQPWIQENGTGIISSRQIGTGENDFALLAITGSATGKPLPSSFPALPLASSGSSLGDTINFAGYGGQGLTDAQIQNALTATLVQGKIEDIFSITGGHSSDGLTISAGSASQSGASGGAIATTDKQLAGIFIGSFTSDSGVREGLATTASYIRRAFAASMGESLDSYIAAKSPSALVASYTPQAVTLGRLLARSIGLSQ